MKYKIDWKLFLRHFIKCCIQVMTIGLLIWVYFSKVPQLLSARSSVSVFFGVSLLVLLAAGVYTTLTLRGKAHNREIKETRD